MSCDQERKFLPLLRAERGNAVIGVKIDRPAPVLQLGFSCDRQDLTSYTMLSEEVATVSRNLQCTLGVMARFHNYAIHFLHRTRFSRLSQSADSKT